MKTYITITLCILASFAIFSCNNDDNASDDGDNMLPSIYGNFEVQADNSVQLNGSITASSPLDLTNLLNDHPNVDKIVIQNIEAQQLAESTVETAAIIHANEINTHLAEGVLVSRGSLDFFLAGKQRTKAESAQIGVGAWRDADGNVATDFEFGDSAHTPYLNYYVDIGILFSDASNFYYFYIQTAGPDDVFILNDEQIELFELLTE